MDATIQAVNAYLQSINPNNENQQQIYQQPSFNPQQSMMNPMSYSNQQQSQYYIPHGNQQSHQQEQPIRNPTSNNQMINYHQLFNLLIHQPQTPPTTLSNSFPSSGITPNNVYGNILDQTNLNALLGQSNLNQQQQSQFNSQQLSAAQFIAMELNRQNQQHNMKQQQLQDAIINGQQQNQPRLASSPGSENGRKRRNRDDTTTVVQAKYSLSQSGSPTSNDESIQVRSRSLTCPETMRDLVNKNDDEDEIIFVDKGKYLFAGISCA